MDPSRIWTDLWVSITVGNLTVILRNIAFETKEIHDENANVNS